MAHGIFRAEDYIPSTFPLTAEQVMDSRWDGLWVKPSSDRHESRCGAVLATIRESIKHAGYFDVSVSGNGQTVHTEKPCLVEFVPIFAEHMLNEHGRTCSDLRWVKSKRDDKYAVEDVIYFLRAGGFVKIGKASGSASIRVAQLQTGCPYQIEVIATIPGGLELERSLHRRFKSLRARGEWFHATTELLSAIDSMAGEA